MGKPQVVSDIVGCYEEVIKLFESRESYVIDGQRGELTFPAIKYYSYLRGKIDALKTVLEINEPNTEKE